VKRLHHLPTLSEIGEDMPLRPTLPISVSWHDHRQFTAAAVATEQGVAQAPRPDVEGRTRSGVSVIVGIQKYKSSDAQVNRTPRKCWRAGWSTCCPDADRHASVRRSPCAASDIPMIARVSVRLRRCCARGAPAVLAKERSKRSHEAHVPMCGSACPLNDLCGCCHSGVWAFWSPRMRRGSIAGPGMRSTAVWQDKSRKVRPGRMAEKCRDINAEARCASLGRDVCFPRSWAITSLATPCADCPYHQSHDRAARRTFRPFCWSAPRRMMDRQREAGAGWA